MGSTVSCNDECTTISSSSVINLSDALIMRFDGIELPPIKHESVTCCGLTTVDDMWYEKLKCIEDSHSRAYGLTYNALNNYISLVEKKIKDIPPRVCTYNKVVKCYERYKDCPIKCAGEINQFIDCIDARRMEKLKVIRDTQRRLDVAKKISKFRRSIF